MLGLGRAIGRSLMGGGLGCNFCIMLLGFGCFLGCGNRDVGRGSSVEDVFQVGKLYE